MVALAVAVCAPIVTVIGAIALPAGQAAAADTLAVGAPSPALAGDAPDPDIVLSGSTYYAFTTGTALGNHIQALVDTSGSPASGFASYTGHSYGSTALPNPPSWETANTQTSPGVFYDPTAGHWIMYYDASTGGQPEGTGHSCLSLATASTLNPPVFTDTSSGPFYCQPTLGGSVDPMPFLDPATGNAYLLWKSNDGGSSMPGMLWIAQLNASGTGFVGQPGMLLDNDTVNHPWESTVENPDMIYAQGTYYLLFSGGLYNSSGYAEGYAVCASVVGPCSQPQAGPILASEGSLAGPGGGALFQDTSGNWWLGFAAWTAGCTSYSCGGARRLYTATMAFAPPPLNQPVVGISTPRPGGGGYWEVARDGGIFSYGTAQFHGSMGGRPLNQPVVGIASTGDGNGYWEVASDGGLFAFGDALFHGSMGGRPLNRPIVGMASTADGNGYWEVASDGGLFAFGDASFYGSTGSTRLNRPIVGMSPSPDGRGYWLVASDGGIFAFGDATFYGSTGSTRLNQPIVGMAATPDGRGYWLVASDGGIFAFGDATFYGSTGSIRLNQPIVGMTATPDGRGYWLVASDGGIFAFGDATFYGSPA